MFGPRDYEPIKARICDLVFEGGKPFIILGRLDGSWEKYEINNDQLWTLFERMAPKLRGR